MKNKALVVVDFSYWMYVTIYGSITEFQKKNPIEYSYWLKDPKETDQHNLPDILNCEAFKKVLKKFVMKRCETIDWHLKGHFKDELDCLDGVDILFAMDDKTSKSFRKSLYPEYKAHRKLMPKQFDIQKVKEYIFDVIFKELELEEKYGYRFISVSGAEADDIIATVISKCSDDYKLKVLFASDHDFLQLEGVTQIDLFGKKIVPKINDEEVSRKEYLICKILTGDKSDNIESVFTRVGPKKALNLARDLESLKNKLKEDQTAAKRFSLNKKLIAFTEIPKQLTESIIEKANMLLYENKVLNDDGFDNLNWL